MKILVADDSMLGREMVSRLVVKWGHEPVQAEDGEEALAVLKGADPPPVGVVDWEMPKLKGPELCARIRESDKLERPYLILLTAREEMSDIIEGLDAGADDYLTKPFDRDELRARVRVGERIAELQGRLRARVAEVEEALSKIKKLEGLLPICAYCKKVRDGDDYWHQVEAYVQRYSDARFSHGICPSCYDEHLKDLVDGDDGE